MVTLKPLFKAWFKGESFLSRSKGNTYPVNARGNDFVELGSSKKAVRRTESEEELALDGLYAGANSRDSSRK
jgi:hypothetical protein